MGKIYNEGMWHIMWTIDDKSSSYFSKQSITWKWYICRHQSNNLNWNERYLPKYTRNAENKGQTKILDGCDIGEPGLLR